MNLLPKLKKKQAGQVGVASETRTESLFGDLTPLINLVAPARKRMAEYDHAVHALATARERLRDLADAAPPDMTLTVQREIAVAMGDVDVLARFDAEYGEAIEAERKAREAAQRDREELPARILALEEVVRQISRKMIADDPIFDIEQEAQRVFEPFAKRLMEAAGHYVAVLKAARSASYALEHALGTYEYDLFASLKHVHRPELFGSFEDGILPESMAGVSSDDIRKINRRVDRIDDDLSTRMHGELEAAGLTGETMRMYFPSSADDPRKIYAPELTRRVKRPPAVPNALAAVVTINN